MRHTLKMALAAAALVTMADAAHAGNIVVHNQTTTPVWVTVYNLMKMQITSFCLDPNVTETVRMSASEQLGSGGAIYIRYEYKKRNDCGGGNSYDSHYGSAIGYPAHGDINQWVPAH